MTTLKTKRVFSSVGWLALFLFLSMGTAQSITDLWSIGAILGTAFFGVLLAFWIRMGWQTLRSWGLATRSTIVAMMLLGSTFSFLLYILWLGKRS